MRVRVDIVMDSLCNIHISCTRARTHALAYTQAPSYTVKAHGPTSTGTCTCRNLKERKTSLSATRISQLPSSNSRASTHWYVCVKNHLSYLQHTATHCNVQQLTSTHCNTLVCVCQDSCVIPATHSAWQHHWNMVVCCYVFHFGSYDSSVCTCRHVHV